MYFKGGWHTLRARVRPANPISIAALDVSVLQDQLLAPVLKIADVRTDKRIDFVGGARGTAELETLVDSGRPPSRSRCIRSASPISWRSPTPARSCRRSRRGSSRSSGMGC